MLQFLTRHGYVVLFLFVLAEQIGSLNPSTAPVWLAGLGFLWLSASGRRLPIIGWTLAVLWVAMIAALAAVSVLWLRGSGVRRFGRYGTPGRQDGTATPHNTTGS